ncbi:hypothetical protein [Stackebrandtia soli]|uniref:hypothetical protein n=1 Tax=Stackebrandtia soli TaxID=1892856 RepID=UPI0039E92F8E
MHVRLVSGAARLRHATPSSSDEAFLFSEAATGYFMDLVDGSRLVAESFPFAAWTEPDTVDARADRLPSSVVTRLRCAAARLATDRALTDLPMTDEGLFSDPVLVAAWERGPEHRVTVRGNGVSPTISGEARLAAFDHFLHHSGEPVVYSPLDFDPVICANAAVGGVVLSAPRLVAELDHLGEVLEATDEDTLASGIRTLATAAGAAVDAGSALIIEYA